MFFPYLDLQELHVPIARGVFDLPERVKFHPLACLERRLCPALDLIERHIAVIVHFDPQRRGEHHIVLIGHSLGQGIGALLNVGKAHQPVFIRGGKLMDRIAVVGLAGENEAHSLDGDRGQLADLLEKHIRMDTWLVLDQQILAGTVVISI